MCCVKLLEIIELMLHSCHGLVCAGLLELGLSLSHTRAQGSVCVSFEPWPLTALPCAVLWELDQSSVQLWEACGREEAVVWWVSASWIVPFRWPLALFSSLTHLDPCGPVRWVCVRGRKARVPPFLVHLFCSCIVHCCECDCQERQWMVSQYLINTVVTLQRNAFGMYSHVSVLWFVVFRRNTVPFVIPCTRSCEIEIEIFHCDSRTGLARYQTVKTFAKRLL